MIPSSTWRHFYRSLFNQSCILILGPHIATFLGEENDEQLLEAFSRQLVSEMKASDIPFDQTQENSLPYTALRWMKGGRRSSTMLREELCSFFDRSVSRVPKVYRNLAKLPFFLVINTSPDEYMKQAFMRAGKDSTQLHYNYQGNQNILIPEITVEQPVVFNLFGTVEDPDSLVITKEDQVDFINNLLRENVSTLPAEILQHFDKDKTYLFLGFDADDWHLPLLFRSLGLHEKKEMSFYLSQESIDKAVKDFYVDFFDFQFVQEDSSIFASDMAKGYQKWLTENEAKNKPAAPEKTLYIDKPQAGMSGKVTVLMMTSNPKDAAALELNDEIDVVEEAHVRGAERRKFFVKPILDIKKEKLLELLLRHKPQIVHFSGHGEGSSGLLFYGADGYADMVQGDALANIFKLFNDQISCVVLNACHSHEQAQVIAQYIPNVIGTDSAIDDDLAIQFTEGFYMALFAGESYEKAFNMAIAHIGLQNFPEGGRPVFYKNGEKYQTN